MQSALADKPNGTDSNGPLSGLVVADFSRVLAGPMGTMYLADMGATVIKVEGPGGDESRQWMPPTRDGVGTYFMSINRNKHSIVLDMKKQEDLEVAYAILDRADVFVENFKPGSLKQFGLDGESVARRWPRMVHASITGFGTKGGATMAGYDLLAQAASGLMDITGMPDGPQMRAGTPIFDVVTGMHATIGVLAALSSRQVTGVGQHVEVDLLSSALATLANHTSGYVAAGNVPERKGNDHPSIFPYGPFNAKDRQIILTIGNARQFSALMTGLGAPEVAEDPRFNTMKQRNINREELRVIMEDLLAERTAHEWFEALQERGVPCSPIMRVNEGVDFAEQIGLEPVIQAGTGDEAVPMIKNPIAFSRSKVSYDKAPPALGADRDFVNRWLAETPVAQPAESYQEATA